MFGLKLFEKWWIIGEQQPRNPNVIVAISYGTRREALIDATRESIMSAAAFAKRYQTAVIAYANPSHCFPGSETIEGAEKQRLLRDGGIARERLVEARPIVNSVTEAEEIKRALHSRGIAPREILLIADRLHGRGLLWIWQRVFPGVRLSLRYINCPAYQSDALFPLQQTEVRWFFANVARQLVLQILGLNVVRKVQHKS